MNGAYVIEAHIARYDILPPIVVDVGNINAHAEHGTLGEPIAGVISKGAIVIDNVEVIVHGKVVAAIHPSISSFMSAAHTANP
jgi:hypothetical protein